MIDRRIYTTISSRTEIVGGDLKSIVITSNLGDINASIQFDKVIDDRALQQFKVFMSVDDLEVLGNNILEFCEIMNLNLGVNND